MSIREDIAVAIHNADGYAIEGTTLQDARLAADAVLAVLGDIDGSIDPELLAAHLRADRDEIAHLRRTVKELQREIDGLGGLLADAESGH